MDTSQQPHEMYTSGPLKDKNKKRQVGLLLAALLLVLATAGAVAWNNKDSASPANNNASKTVNEEVLPEAVISITDQGFSPAAITVKKGQPVTWQNSDEAIHQVAGDPHPQHDEVEGFFAPTPLNAGDSYTFVFDKAGTYHYHDELNPEAFSGTIIVE